MTQFREFQDGEIVPGTRYRVERLVGVGGMGSVYEVEHIELGKRFVLKALLRALARREDLVARLRNEWRALARLEHPSIVNVTDAGTSANGVPFYVMERLEGETLAARLRGAIRLLVPDALKIAVGILEGLSAAHEIGVIHRDVKPPNIFLVRGGAPKLLDFGVAKVADAGGVITARGIAIGTPRYMSPEQARGESLDGRSDVYATGLILFEMIAGRGPFDDTRDANELLLAHITRAAPRLSSLTVVAPELDAIVASMLEKDPNLRPESARALATALRFLSERYAISASTDAPTPNAQYSAETARGPASGASAPTTRPDGVASRQSTPDATTREQSISTREVTVQVRTEEVLARAGLGGDPTTLHVPRAVLARDTVIDPLTHAGDTSYDGVRADGVDRTELLLSGPSTRPPPNDAPPTRTAVPVGDSAPNLTPPPVVPASARRAESSRRLWVPLAMAATFVVLLALVAITVAATGGESTANRPVRPAAQPAALLPPSSTATEAREKSIPVPVAALPGPVAAQPEPEPAPAPASSSAPTQALAGPSAKAPHPPGSSRALAGSAPKASPVPSTSARGKRRPMPASGL